jgi:hypothetical protein
VGVLALGFLLLVSLLAALARLDLDAGVEVGC